jgi:hypothetical protein
VIPLTSFRADFNLKMACTLVLIFCLIGLAPSQGGQQIPLYEKHNGWSIWGNNSDEYVDSTMEVLIDGASFGKMARIIVYHKSANYSGSPEIADIYASGYVKLKQNADPRPTIPLASSFILGPAYNGTNDTSEAYMYNNSPQLDRIEINTSLLPDSPLIMKAFGSNRDFRVAYEMSMPKPTDELTRLHVNQTYVASENITINQTARDKHEGFKIVQFSSMFINEGGTCKNSTNCSDIAAAPTTDCHDSNAARYMGGVLIETAFKNLTLPSFILNDSVPMTELWLDLLHTDNESWQGNTPNLRIQLDSPYDGGVFVPQGWIQDDNCPSNDNVGLWIHDDGAASMNWSKGQEGRISYWLLAQDNPPELSNLTAFL